MKRYIFPNPIDSTCVLTTDGGIIIRGVADTYPDGEPCQSYTIPASVPNSQGAGELISHAGYVSVQHHGILLWGSDFLPSYPPDQALLILDVFPLTVAPKPPKPPDPPDPPTKDEFPFATASIVNSPPATLTFPITAAITKVHFQSDGWIVDFDKRLGANAWPSVTSPGWDGPLQYTLGLCRNQGGKWTCSAVVQFWQDRLEQEGAAAGSPPNRIAQDWFYDSRWGNLEGWQPAVGEMVGVFISAGDGRNTSVVFPGTVPQRTAAILVKWGTDR